RPVRQPLFCAPAAGRVLKPGARGGMIKEYFFRKRGALPMDKPTTPLPVCEIMGVRISVTAMPQTVRCIREHLEGGRGRYICVSNVHTTVTAYGDPAYRDVQNGAVLALPDGGPLSRYSRRKGFAEAQRVTGPDLMQQMLRAGGETPYRHYFYGSTPETLACCGRRSSRHTPAPSSRGWSRRPSAP